VEFNSTPNGAQVLANEVPVGETPCKVELKRDQEYMVVMEKEGYKSSRDYIGHGIGTTWIVLDVLAGIPAIALVVAPLGDTSNAFGGDKSPSGGGFSILVFLGIIAGGIPAGIDALTGDWYSLDETSVSVVLEKQQ